MTRDNFLFTINDSFIVKSSVGQSTCREQSSTQFYCCDTHELPRGMQYQIPSSFGVRARNDARNLLAIPSNIFNLDVEQFTTVVFQSFVDLSTGGQVMMPNVLLLRFVTREFYTMCVAHKMSVISKYSETDNRKWLH